MNITSSSSVDSCLVLVGEKSGEEHCMTFFPALKALLPDVHFFGVGGDEMQEQGMELIYHLREFSGWGITEVVARIPFYYGAMKKLLQEVDRRKCKSAILIDFQTFNLKLATKLKDRGIDVLYYVAPQAWAWKAWRGKVLARTVHTLFTILPFEKDWFQGQGVGRVMAVPHPLLLRFKHDLALLERKRAGRKEGAPSRLLLLPGSRNNEVRLLLPVFMEAVESVRRRFPLEIMLVRSSSVDPALYEFHLDRLDHHCVDSDLAQALIWADLSLAASGTVTLATALFNLPTIVCYKASLFTAFIYENFISYKGFISLPNIVHGSSVFPELKQDSATAYNIEVNLVRLLSDQAHFAKTRAILQETKNKLSGDSFSLPDYMAQVIGHRK